VRRFFHNNETLLKVGSLVFAGAGVLRAQPKEDAVAILQCLLIVMGLVIFFRMWEDLPRRYGVLPGERWTLGLAIVYYSLTIALIVSVVYLTQGLADQRYKYLWIVLGSLLAVGGASLLTHRSGVEHSLAGAILRLLGEHARVEAAGVLVTVLLVLTIVVGYGAAHAVSPAINAALDQVFGVPPSAAAPPR
jgi:hypothetical protein